MAKLREVMCNGVSGVNNVRNVNKYIISINNKINENIS